MSENRGAAEPVRLSSDQQRALDQLERHFHQEDGVGGDEGEGGDGRPAPRVFGVVGARGRGKTTVMRALRDTLATSEKIAYVQTPIIDAAIVHEDEGIAAAAIEHLQLTIEDYGKDVLSRDVPWNGFGRDERGRWEEQLGSLREKYQDLLLGTLSQQESHRKLAHDLAMSPGHYATMVQKAAERRKRMRSVLIEYFRALTGAHEAARRHAGVTSSGAPVRLVVYLDDVDLADPKLVQAWTRALLADSCSAVCWVIAFDLERMTASLSPRSLSSKSASSRTEDMEVLDLEVGRSLLAKMVRADRRAHLGPWKIAERRTFVPIFEGRPARAPRGAKAGASASPAAQEGRPTIGALLRRAGRADTLPLLPLAPRALTGLYHWLVDQLAVPGEGSGSPRPALGAAEGGSPKVPEVPLGVLLQQLATSSGEHQISDELTRWSPARFGARLKWDGEVRLSWAAWDRLAMSAAAPEPMQGLPIPKALAEVTALEPEALVEGLLDAALADGLFSAHSLLRRMPFAKQVLLEAAIVTTFPDDDVVEHFGLPSPSRMTALAWQKWAPVPARWTTTIGPDALWEAHYGTRQSIPTDLFRQLYLSTTWDDGSLGVGRSLPTSLPPTPHGARSEPRRAPPRASPGEVQDPLPRRCRALMLLVAQLARAPFREIEASRQLWSPLAMAQAAAAVTLSSYSICIWGESPGGAPSLHTASVSAASLIRMSERALEAEYALLLRWLAAQPLPDEEPSPLAVAHAALHTALRALLALPEVVGLVGDGGAART